MPRSFGRVVFFGALLVLAGCGGPQTAEVSGKVDYDGKPLPEGEIYFVGEGKAPEILPIKDGNYSGKVTTGKKKVEIYAYKEGKPLPKNTPGAAEAGTPKVNYIPPQYNTSSKTYEEVKAGGPNTFTYSVSKL